MSVHGIRAAGTVSVKASGSVALANQVFKISWQWLANGFSGSIIQVFKMGPVVGNLAWRNVEFGKFRLRRPFYEGASPLDPHLHVVGAARACARANNGEISWHNLISAHLRMAFRGEKANQVRPLEFLNS